MFKKLSTFALAALVTLGVVTPALAGTFGWVSGRVTLLAQGRDSYNSGRTSIQLDAGMGSCAEFFIEPATSNREYMFRMLTAAQLAGRKVGVSRDDVTCEIRAVRIENQ